MEEAMAQLEFSRQTDDVTIASAQAGDREVIPSLRDDIYVPDGADPRVYFHLRVSGRQFYYDQRGHLTMVRLSCEVL
jgi:hypothetical protein